MPSEEIGTLDLSDNDLLRMIASDKDRDAFTRLFGSLAPRVKSYMMKLGADPDTADEIAQETFVIVWRKAALFDARKSSAITWIFTIARNLRVDRLRKDNRPALDPNEPLLVPEDPPSALHQLEQATIIDQVTKSIAALPSDQREAVHLSFIKGLSHKEISETLDVPLGTVKSRLRLSFEKLRLSLEELR